MYGATREQLTKSQIWSVLGAGAVGALAYTFSDTFWFSAIEGEVYAMSSLFTAIAFWAILQWEHVAEKPHSTRWLILIAYLMGLSIGVHILNLLTIPALVLVYYFKKHPNVTKFGIFKALAVSGAILLAINALIIPYTVAIGAWFDKIFVNSFNLPVNSGLLFFAVALFTLAGWGVYYTHKKGKVTANIIVLCTTVIFIGFSSYASVVIRASANPPMNSNDPSNAYTLLSFLNREQYGTTPLLNGPHYSTPMTGTKTKTSYALGEDNKYHAKEEFSGYEFPDELTTLFPRMWSQAHEDNYKSWIDVKGKTVNYRGHEIVIPTAADNMKFFFSFQLNYMYWRYFLWNFVGRQSNIQSNGSATNGNWLSGIDVIDQLYLGPQDNLPSEMADNKGRNTYYFLPFILGLLGLFYQLKQDKNNFSIVMMLFLMMGIVLVIYFNNKPFEPRERDYIFAGSFYAFSIWIGLGVLWLKDNLSKYIKRDGVVISIAAITIASSVPIILAAQNWDDHDRSGRYFTRDIGANYLNSTLPNSIVVNYGDNDTFPLWYSQEVENTRLDVKIMNESYLGQDWYVDQMLIKSNESAAVPSSLPKSKYSQYDRLAIEDIFDGDTIPIADAMIILHSEELKTKRYSPSDKKKVDFLPARNIAIPVNKENAIASGIVAAKDAHLMVDTVYISISTSKDALTKSEVIMFDLLANFDWKRPIYFTGLGTINTFGLGDYMQFDGILHRLVPIKTTENERFADGRIDSDVLYSNLMEKFKYGNLSDPDVFVDNFVILNTNATRLRSAFPLLAKQLLVDGDTTRAVEVLDRGLAELPIAQLGHYHWATIEMIEAYYAANAYEKGNILMDDYIKLAEEYVEYYATFPKNKSALVANDLNTKLQILKILYSLALDNKQMEQVERIYKTFEKYGV